MKNRIINYRPFAIIFLGLLIGVNIVSAIIKQNITLWVALAVLSCLIILFFIIYSVVLFRYKNGNDSDYVMDNEHYKVRALKVIKGTSLFALAIILALSSSFACLGYKLQKLDSIITDDKVSLDCTLTGRVVKTNGTSYAVLENISVDGENFRGVKIKIRAIDTNNNFAFAVGDVVVSEARIFKNSLVYSNGELNLKMLTDDIYYSGYFKSEYVGVSHDKTNIFEKINITTKEKLNQFMNKDCAGISTALLLGDKDYLEDDVYDTFKNSGLAHILSISGLHVGFIVALLLFCLKKCKVSPKVQFVICAVFLLLYSTICGFASSVVRASIMSLCLMLSFLCKERGDMLSSLGLAGILIMLLNPFNALELGFKLSFLAVFGLLTLSRPICDFLNKLHIPNVISSSIATTISAELMTLPVGANYFGGLPVVALFANLALLPIFSAIFSLLFVAFLLNLALPLGFLFVPFSFVLTSFMSVTAFFSSFGVIDLLVFSSTGTIAYYLLLFSLSNFVMLKAKLKLYISSVLVVILTISLILGNFTYYNSSNELMIFSGVDNTAVVTTNKSEVVMIGMGDSSDYQFGLLQKSLFQKRLQTIDTLCLPLYVSKNQEKLLELCNTKQVKNVILPTTLSEIDKTILLDKLPTKTNVTFSNFENLSFSNLTINALNVNGKTKAVMTQIVLETDIEQLLLVQDKLTTNQAEKIISDYNIAPNYVVANGYSEGLEKVFGVLATNYKIIFNSRTNFESEFLSTQPAGNFIDKIDSLCWTYSF